MTVRHATLGVLGAALVVATPAVAAAQHEHHGESETLGKVSFPTSCAPAVQPTFDRAVAMLHSFWFEQANAAFEEVAKGDPSCAMAHWGIAMTALGNPFVGQPLPEPRIRHALAALATADSLATGATERERLYIAAAAAVYDGALEGDKRPRYAGHEAAMKVVHERFPDDDEAALFHARAIIAASPLSDTTFAGQLRAAAIMEPLMATHADHPGLAHYLIHTFDSPRLAKHGLAAAKRYADIAPAAPHALHMPSHIFTRLGYWDESIATNRRSAAAEPDSNAAVHPMDYMVYAYLQQGRDAEAGKVVARAAESMDRFYLGILGYNFAAMHARYALERGRWAEATALRVPENASAFVQAVPRFARALGHARQGHADAARAEVAELERLTNVLRERGDAYWATVVGAQKLAAEAWVARAEGRTDDALRLAREGAALEETVEKHPVTPGPLVPARELLGELLLELGRHADAQAAFEKTLEREPLRARALYGAARSAELAGKKDAARAHYTALASLMDRADAGRAEVGAARKFLAVR
jgi:hypothetical protein